MNVAQAKALVSVEDIIGTRIELHRRGAVLVGPCPFHEDQGRPNLVVFPKTQTWQCFACGAQGDAIDFLSRSENITVREAIGMIGRGNTAPSAPIKRLPVPRAHIASVEVRDAAYRGLIAAERLSPSHRAALLRRGFSLDETNAGQYRTHFPGKAPDGLAPEGVPGFYSIGGTWLTSGPPGLLILVRDREGRIAACQVRPDNADKGKYLWLSSPNKPGGASSGAPCHFAAANGSQLWITEGPLKADLVAARLGQPCLGVAGVSNWHSAIPLLGDAQEVILAFDQDEPGPTRTAVEGITRAFTQDLAARGIKVHQATWDWSQAKGIDDALRSGTPFAVE
jgi:hypothetical protein